MKKKQLFVILALLFALPMFADDNPEHLSQTLMDLRGNLKRDYLLMSKTKERLTENYKNQHTKMVDIMKECNELSLLLYSQKQEFTFDISYTLEKVKREFNEFGKDTKPYNTILRSLDIEIDRYARLLESLRRLPPELDRITGIADSLLYRNDTLDQQHLIRTSQLEMTIEAATLHDTVSLPFILNERSQQDRDSCIYYAKELLQMYFESKAILIADSIHYNEAYQRLKESYEYACEYYKLLQQRIFVDGQTPWPTILYHFDQYWTQAVADTKEKYAIEEIATIIDTTQNVTIDTILNQVVNADSITAMLPATDTLTVTQSISEEDASMLAKKFEYSVQIFILVFLIVSFLLLWLITRLLLIPVFMFIKPIKRAVAKQQKPYIALLVAMLAFIIFNTEKSLDDTILSKALILSNTFIWLLAAIILALLIRLKPEQLRNGIRLYCPTIFTAFTVISCRVIFLPNTMMNIIFPPLLILFFFWQLHTCLKHVKTSEKSDQIFSWISLTVTGVAMLIAISGYIFASLLILVWWFFQMAAILTMITIGYLMVKYKEKRMNPRIVEYLNNITTVTGQDKKSYLFKVTWFYDLVKGVLLPLLILTSLPLCLHLAMDVFDFDDLYTNMFYSPFLHLTNSSGVDTFRVSLYTIVLLVSLFFIFRYINNAIHSIWQQGRYARYLKKTQRQTIHKDEVNLSLGNSIINFLVWIIYGVIVVITLHIPTGSLSLIAGGFSAGVGLALKDILNNFIYGIQLMSGRLKVGDWIECDGIRGKVTDISYQTTQVLTIHNTTVSFLNASLFAKSFTNITKGSSYEFLKIVFGVSYGTDVQHVREVVENALQVLRTKDEYGREIVDPKYGIYVRFDEFSDSSVDIAVKQYVIASERIPYTDKAREIIYNALNENGIQIPFPQRDIHIITERQDSED